MINQYLSHGTYEDEKAKNAELARSCKNCIVEIGVLDGDTSKIFLENNNKVKIYGIDPIIPDSMMPELIGSENKIINLVWKYPNYVFLKEFSYNIVKKWNNPISYIFIDGDHNYEAVKRDFENWIPFVEYDGLIGIHDSAKDRGGHGWEGPSRLCDELFSDKRIEYVDTVLSLTIFRKVRIEKVDIIINVYGKPYQTLCALKTLMSHSGFHVDKIYFISEKIPPFNDDPVWITKYFNNVILYIPPINHYFETRKDKEYYNDEEHRFCLKYQYGIEKSNKKYVFILHNDMHITGDIIGDMLNQIGDTIGIGLIGMCWNCPANKAGKCDGNRIENFKPTYDEVIDLINQYGAPRMKPDNINKEIPMPLPECRLSEYACLINREITLKETWPNGDVPLFGSYGGNLGIDMGCEWYRHMVLKGYKFKNYNIDKTSVHGYYAPLNAGCMVQYNKQWYDQSENTAKESFTSHFNNDTI